MQLKLDEFLHLDFRVKGFSDHPTEVEGVVPLLPRQGQVYLEALAPEKPTER